MPLGKPRKQQDVAFALMVSLGMEVLNVFAQCSPQGVLASTMSLDKHSSLADLIQRSA